MDEIAPRGDELVVVAADELRPREVRVLVFRARDHQVVPQSVCVVLLEHVLHVDDVAAAGRQLGPFHVQELARHDVVRQLVRMFFIRRAHQDGRPQHRVERDVVLAHRVVVTRLRVLPPLLPGIRLAALARPLDRGREITDDRVEPYVDLLGRVLLPARQRHWHAPVEVSCDGPRLEVAHELE